MALLRGTSDDGGTVHGRDIRTVARKALLRAQVGIGCDPRRLALALGYRVRAVTVDEPAIHSDGLVAFRWSPDTRECGLNVFLALARVLFREDGIAPTARDSYRLAGWLAVPEEIRSVAVEWGTVQPHAPIWFLEAISVDVDVSGVRPKPPVFGQI